MGKCYFTLSLYIGCIMKTQELSKKETKYKKGYEILGKGFWELW